MGALKRIEVTELLCDRVNDEFDGKDIDYMINWLQAEKQKRPTHHKIFFDLEYDYEDTRLQLKGKRLENDQEYEARKRRRMTAREKKQEEAKKKEDKERKEYERLKKKFGD